MATKVRYKITKLTCHIQFVVKYLITVIHCLVQNDFGNTALVAAVVKGHLHIAEILVKNGANVNYRNKVIPNNKHIGAADMDLTNIWCDGNHKSGNFRYKTIFAVNDSY